eukprot:CAMPEP_0176418056 /NCGR_PEP_ID=MMETSP0127-20121128/7238_1 /TAXON_ID=938130 /ORGANISM="Platyophrya macrostoma, Strain WH" /LENGTH=438 /DNA_ID=CAMNT_0017798297 /DNA_START=29 /DNA_END=1345 /DNA_ORIENTATION=-
MIKSKKKDDARNEEEDEEKKDRRDRTKKKEPPPMESKFDEKEVVVIDNGTDCIKIGFSGEDYPQMILPSVVGEISVKNELDASNKTQYVYGDKVRDHIQNMSIKYPIECAKIPNSDNRDLMVKYWTHILENEMNLDLTTVNLLIVDHAANDKDYKAELAEYFFEDVKISSLLFMNSSTLSLFSTGRTRGLVVESGHGVTGSVPVFEGFILPHATNFSTISGQDINDQLYKVLSDKGIKLDKSKILTQEILKDMKEKILSVPLDYEQMINGPDPMNEEERTYELPDGITLLPGGGAYEAGSFIQLDHRDRFSCTEILFRPSLIGSTAAPLHEMIWDSLQKCDEELRKELYENIVYSGGTTMLKGFTNRIKYELNYLIPKDVSRADIKYVIEGNRRYAAWIGGSMLGSLSVFQNLAITKSEFEENTASEVRRSVVIKKTF